MIPARPEEAAPLPRFDEAAPGRGLPPGVEALISRAGALRRAPEEEAGRVRPLRGWDEEAAR